MTNDLVQFRSSDLRSKLEEEAEKLNVDLSSHVRNVVAEHFTKDRGKDTETAIQVETKLKLAKLELLKLQAESYRIRNAKTLSALSPTVRNLLEIQKDDVNPNLKYFCKIHKWVIETPEDLQSHLKSCGKEHLEKWDADIQDFVRLD